MPSGIAGPQALQHWQAVRADGAIQFQPLPPYQPAPPPAWLGALGRWLEHVLLPMARAFGAAWPLAEKLMIAATIAGAAVLVWMAARALIDWRQGRVSAESAAPWVPGEAAARELLIEADQLAAQGRFDEATHLLLLRSFEQIQAARPEWLHPSSTAREIADLPALAPPARAAFGTIAARVEACRYALRPLAAPDWQAARAAYADFALQRLAA